MEKRGILEVMMEDRGALSIREFLKKHRLVADGAMGTYYSTLKRGGNLLSELDNDKDPEIIKTIHKNYIEAGANLIRINTFACYPDVLGVDEAESAKLCRNAVKIAKQAVIEAKNNAELLGKEESPLEVERKEVFIAGISLCELKLGLLCKPFPLLNSSNCRFLFSKSNKILLFPIDSLSPFI